MPAHAPHRPDAGLWRPSGRAALVGLLMVLVGLAVGVVVVSRGARATGELGLDVAVARDRPSWAAAVAHVVDQVVSPVVAVPVALVAAAVRSCRGDARAALRFLILAGVGWGAVGLAKLAFRRPRPPTGEVDALVLQRGADSFPSGHTALATSLLLATLLTLPRSRARRWLTALALPLIALVAASRLVVGAHYLGDVTAAPLVAGGSILVVAFLIGRVDTRAGPEGRT